MNLNEFVNTTVGDVVVKDVVAFSPDTRMADVALSLLKQQISGAPVIDEDKKCIGVISVVDVIGAEGKVAETQARLADEFFASSDLLLPTAVYADKLQSLGSDVFPAADQPVSNFMVTSLVTAKGQDTLASVIQRMIDAHIHRVIVTDAEGRLEGIVSTTDILACILRESREKVTSA